MKPKLLFVIGPHKSSTSSLVGILNCHPGIFMLYETDLTRPAITKYGLQLLERLPQARRFFHLTDNVETSYRAFARFLCDHTGNEYLYTGDKIVTMDLAKFQDVDAKFIFPIRDLRTWLAKDTIIRYYRTDIDAVPVAIDFVRYAIDARRFPSGLCISMEDLIQENDVAVSRLGEHLELDLAARASRWWEKVGLYPSGDPKRFQTWNRGHYSSTQSPEKVDTVVELEDHPFWREILPIFDRYHGAGAKVSKSQMRADLARLENLRVEYSAPLGELYARHVSEQPYLKNRRIFGIRAAKIHNTVRRLRSMVSSTSG